MKNKGIKSAALLIALSGQASQAQDNSNQEVKIDEVSVVKENKTTSVAYQKFSFNREVNPMSGFYSSHFNDSLTDVKAKIDHKNNVSMKVGKNEQGDDVAIGYIKGRLTCITKEKSSGRQIKEEIIRETGVSKIEVMDENSAIKITRAPGCDAMVDYNGDIRSYPDNYDFPKSVSNFDFTLNKGNEK